MIHIILLLSLICSPDGIKSDGKAKAKGASKQLQPYKTTLVVIPSNNSPATPATGNEERPVIQKQTTPCVTALQQGINSAQPEHPVSLGDTFQKSPYPLAGYLKWEP